MYILYLLLPLLIVANIKCEMSEKQLKSATKLIRNVCQSKSKISNALIESMYAGEFVQDPMLMCYMECCLRIGKLMKDGKFDLNSSLSQSQNLPATRRQGAIDSSHSCKDAGSDLADKCEVAFAVYKCIYDFKPDNFFLP